MSAVAIAAAALAVGLGRTAPPPKPVPNHAFRSTAQSQDPAILWAVGDGADGSDAAKALARRIGMDGPDRVLYLGDVYERGSASDFRHGYDPVYGRFARVTAPTPGNHDWPSHPEGYDRYWSTRTGAPTPPWYAFRAAGWHVISLNSEAPHDAASAQIRWLRNELRRARGTCTLAFWHRPLMSAGRHGDQGDVAPLWRALRGRATLVLNGHDHDLQRFRPREGITEIVVGAGGRSHYALRRDRRLAFGDDRSDGALRMELRPGSVDLTFVGVDGRALDRSAVTCSPGP